MFKRSNDDFSSSHLKIGFTWNGRALRGCEGDTVASALLGAGVRANRVHPVSGQERAPFCMMGTCFECLVEIDGVPNRQACQVRLQEGMTIRPQIGARK